MQGSSHDRPERSPHEIDDGAAQSAGVTGDRNNGAPTGAVAHGWESVDADAAGSGHATAPIAGSGGDEPEAVPVDAELDQAIADGNLDWQTLIRIASWSTEDGPEKRLSDHYYRRALAAFKAQHPKASVTLFRNTFAAGAYLLADRELQITVIAESIDFDWSRARQLLFTLDALGDETESWLPAAEQSAHIERIFGLVTHVLDAVGREQRRRKHSGTPSEEVAATAAYEVELEMLEGQYAQIREMYLAGAQRAAQVQYAKGMAIGGLILLLCSAAVAGALVAWSSPLLYCVSLVAGGVGAVISVLQRMASDSLRLDFQAAGPLLRVFGAVRPFIGAVFGLLVFLLFTANLVPAIQVPHPDREATAFFAVFCFFAGFNERFAQDMIVGAAKRLGTADAPNA